MSKSKALYLTAKEQLREEINTLAARVSLECDVLLGLRVIGQERWERMERDRFGLYQNIITEGIPIEPVFGSV